jgi:hypothetical protein
MKTYKVLVCNTSRYYQTVLVQANSEEEAEEKVELEELWRDKSWELDHEHCEVEYVETAEEGEIAECSLEEATHILLNGQVYPFVEKVLLNGQVYPFVEKAGQNHSLDGITFLKNSHADVISMITSNGKHFSIFDHIPIQVFEIFGIKPVKVIE